MLLLLWLSSVLGPTPAPSEDVPVNAQTPPGRMLKVLPLVAESSETSPITVPALLMIVAPSALKVDVMIAWALTEALGNRVLPMNAPAALSSVRMPVLLLPITTTGLVDVPAPVTWPSL